MGTPAVWSRVKEIVGSALEQPVSARRAFVAQACGDEIALVEEVNSLLAAFDGAGDFSRGPGFIDPTTELKPQSMIGPYRLERELGAGGMGQVWLASQTEPVQRLVALKIIRAALFDPGLIQRFRAEQQSLASMNHPAIAKVFEAGATRLGQPWFVMEFVDGPPITDFCNRHKLDVRSRLELFLKVCDGVQHAHQKAVIHRDLKPSNILVAEIDGVSSPRIIDFGLAKPTDSSGPRRDQVTQFGIVLGTPGYMSPEQADPAVEDIDTRTDVYSLGVVLYELLTGTLPHEAARWRMQRIDQILHDLREIDPPRPSSRVVNSNARAAFIDGFGTHSRQLARQLRGELDWITLRALERDRERRYGSAAELAADIRRHLDNRTVLARPATAAYRLRKYILRNRFALTLTAGAFLLLASFAAVQAIQLRRITRERDRADRISGFVTGMFNVSDPSESRGNTVTAREILDRSASDIDKELVNDPDMRAEMMNVLGQVYDSLGLFNKAEPLLRESLALRRKRFGPASEATLQSMEDYGFILYEQGRYKDAEVLQHQTLEGRRKVLGAHDSKTLATMSNLAATLNAQERYAEAAALEHETLDLQRAFLGLNHEDTLNSMNNLANTLTLSEHHAEAEKLERETIAIQTRVLGSDHPDTLRSQSNLANTLFLEGRLSEAETLGRQVVDAEAKVVGPEHPDLLVSVNNLADVLNRQGKFNEAEALARRALDARMRLLGPAHKRTMFSMQTLGEALLNQGRMPEAEKLLLAAVEGLRTLGSPARLDTASATYSLAALRARQQRPEEALALLQQAIRGGLRAAECERIAIDPNLAVLRNDPHFLALVAEAGSRAAPTH